MFWMIIDIFSSFDPISFISINKSTNILLITRFILIMLVQLSFWLVPARYIMPLFLTFKIIYDQLIRTFTKNLKGVTLIVTTIFTIIIIINLLGINPYTFRLSRHLIITLSLGLPMWLSFILSSSTYNLKATIAHLLPDGAPDWLNPFLILIETTRIVVRPLTLSFRLAANIRAGHIVLGLIRIYGAAALVTSLSSSIPLVLTALFYVLFEFAICLIQAYIFCLLLSLYANDHAHFLPSNTACWFRPNKSLYGGRQN